MQLTINLHSSELLRSDNHPALAAEWGELSPTVAASLTRLAQVAQRVRDHFGVPLTVSSGYRSEELNAALDPPGSTNSRHMQGLAMDFRLQGITGGAVLAAEADQRFGWHRLTLYRSGRLHGDLRPVEDGPSSSMLYVVAPGGWRRITREAARALRG